MATVAEMAVSEEKVSVSLSGIHLRWMYLYLLDRVRRPAICRLDASSCAHALPLVQRTNREGFMAKSWIHSHRVIPFTKQTIRTHQKEGKTNDIPRNPNHQHLRPL